MNSRRLKARMIEQGISVEDIGRKMGYSVATAYRKINGSSGLTVKEAIEMAKALNLSDDDILHIFFADESQISDI